ncbi:MAG: hypothetical protein H6973_18440 [Gammaproteobacteria bacterium]|nr:hypothetical protein [Gammaproteobacteria bacterium]
MFGPGCYGLRTTIIFLGCPAPVMGGGGFKARWHRLPAVDAAAFQEDRDDQSRRRIVGGGRRVRGQLPDLHRPGGEAHGLEARHSDAVTGVLGDFQHRPEGR